MPATQNQAGRAGVEKRIDVIAMTIRSAIADVQKAGCTAAEVRVEAEAFTAAR